MEDARKARTEGADLQQRFGELLGQRLNELTQRNEQRIGEMRATLEARLKGLQGDNAARLAPLTPHGGTVVVGCPTVLV